MFLGIRCSLMKMFVSEFLGITEDKCFCFSIHKPDNDVRFVVPRTLIYCSSYPHLLFLVPSFVLGYLWIGWYAEMSALVICRSSLLAWNDTTPSSILSSSGSSSPLPPDGVATELYFLWFNSRLEMKMFSSLEYYSIWSSLDSSVLILLSFLAFSLSGRFIAHNTWTISCRMGNSSSNFSLMNDSFFEIFHVIKLRLFSVRRCSGFPHCCHGNNEQTVVKLYKLCVTVMIVNNSHCPGSQ